MFLIYKVISGPKLSIIYRIAKRIYINLFLIIIEIVKFIIKANAL